MLLPLRRMSLFRRLPTLRWVYRPRPLFSAKVQQRYQALQDDFTFLHTSLEPAYHRFFEQASREQNQVRLVGCIHIGMAALLSASAAGVVAMPSIPMRIACTSLGVLVALLTQFQGRSSLASRSLNHRKAAEQLRQMAFAYLAKAAPYQEADRQQVLCQDVASIERSLRDDRAGE